MNKLPNEQLTNRDAMNCDDWWALTRADLRSDPGRASALFDRLTNNLTQSHLEEDILLAWHNFSEHGRANVAYASHKASGPSLDLIQRLFTHPFSGTRERHQLMAGLAVSCRERGKEAEKLLFDLLDQIGAYPETELGTRRQTILNNFVNSVHKMGSANTSNPG